MYAPIAAVIAVLAVSPLPVVAQPRAVKAAASTQKSTKAKPAPKRVAPAAPAIIVQYQRVGHALMRLQDLRGFESCAELWPLFRAIKIDAAVATPEARLDTGDALTELQTRIERMRGIELTSECLNNPLADACR